MDVVIFDKDKENNNIVKNICFRYSFKQNIEWEIYVFEFEKEMKEYMEYSQFVKLILAGIECLKKDINWKKWKNNYIVLMGKSSAELVKYVSPGFRPAGLLLKPVKKEIVEELLYEIQQDCQEGKKEDDYFYFKIKSQEYMILKDNILFFESRNRKIILRSDKQEIEFYDTLERLENEFKPSFVRVHKSFLVNFSKISMIHFSYKTIHFTDGTYIPFSRTYKERLEIMWEKRKSNI